jgi:hypothetical protein
MLSKIAHRDLAPEIAHTGASRVRETFFADRR